MLGGMLLSFTFISYIYIYIYMYKNITYKNK